MAVKAGEDGDDVGARSVWRRRVGNILTVWTGSFQYCTFQGFEQVLDVSRTSKANAEDEAVGVGIRGVMITGRHEM